ncbi:hypothetical protein IF687_01760 [Ureaplasma urealyticum]|uniref:hypothetical protein n=1 Tax=Ureaplasma urealyticum TaxID=2130 RepID=UPI001F5FF78D|nr:hypothetical protein [Ureaplasma urealyticum]UNT66551.1 hypothetical protein IF687_01760 [Ureaplasma urealyticum]
MKTILIVNKSFQKKRIFDTRFLHDSGPIYTNDRFLKIVRESFDAHINKKSKFLFYFMEWWFQTTNYKLNPEISHTKRSLRSWLIEIFFLFCIIALIVCILAGVARPIIDCVIKSITLSRGQFKGDLIIDGRVIAKGLIPSSASGLVGGSSILNVEQWELIPKVWKTYFSSPSVVVLILLVLFFLFFSCLYIYMLKKIRPRTNKMSLEDYLVSRMNLINSFKFILKRKVLFVEGIKEYNHRFIFNMSADYNLMRLMNYIYSGLVELNIIMVVDFESDEKIFELQKIIKQDFDNLDLIILEKEVADKLKSIHQNGCLNSKNPSLINISNKEIDQNQEIQNIEIY